MKTAQKGYKEIVDMSIEEIERFFAIIAIREFEKDYYNHGEDRPGCEITIYENFSLLLRTPIINHYVNAQALCPSW